MTTNLMAWAETASAGDRLAAWASMTVEEQPTEDDAECELLGLAHQYIVTHDDSGRVIWAGEATSTEAAYERACRADSGSRCGWSDAELGAARRVLRRGGLTIATDDRGLYAAPECR